MTVDEEIKWWFDQADRLKKLVNAIEARKQKYKLYEFHLNDYIEELRDDRLY